MIHSYSYRTLRVSTSLPVEFITETGILFGMSKDMSENGLLVDFGEPVLDGTTGQIRFRTGHCVLELRAQVAHTEAFTAGLVFLFSSERENAFVRSMVQALSNASDQPVQANF